MNLLVADDEPFIRNGLLQLDWGSVGVDDVYPAQNGTEARALLTSTPIDIAILDICMPGVSGLELAEQIQKESLDIAVIFLTGFSEFEYAQKAVHYGVTEYLLKPFSPKEILLTVKRVKNSLDQKREQEKAFRKYHDEEGSFDAEKQVRLYFSGTGDIVGNILMEIASNYTQAVSLGELAIKFNYTENYLSKKIRQETGYSFSNILLALRLMNVARLLSEGEKVGEAAGRSGFNDQRYFSQVFRKAFGESPSDWKQENPGKVLRFHEVLAKLAP